MEYPEIRGSDGQFASLTLYIGVGITSGANNNRLLCSGCVFVWMDQTRTKLGNNKQERVYFLFQML